MKISVIIPVYNASNYIEKCLASVMEQTYSDIECILVDDCSPDDTIQKCEKLIRNYDGAVSFKILHHKKNRGLSASRNTGTEAAAGDYIFYLDSDDYLAPNCLDLLVSHVKRHPDVELVQGGTESIPSSSTYTLDFLKGIEYIDEKFWLRKFFFDPNKSFPVTAWNKLVKRDFILKNNLHFKEGLIHEDWMWMYWMTGCVQKIAIEYQPTYIHIRRSNSIMTTSSKERTAHHWGVILTEIMSDSDSPAFKWPLLRTLLFFVKYSGYKVDTECYEALYKSYAAALKKFRFHFLRFLLGIYHGSKNETARTTARRAIKLLVKLHFRRNAYKR